MSEMNEREMREYGLMVDVGGMLDMEIHPYRIIPHLMKEEGYFKYEIINMISEFKEWRRAFEQCERTIHNYKITDSVATPETGYEEYKCTKCGHQGVHYYY